MTGNKFHFFSLSTATRYHIARLLAAKNWERVNNERDASLTDKHLFFDENIGGILEHKGHLAELIRRHQLALMPLTYCIDDETKDDVIAEIIYKHYMQNQQYVPHRDIKWILKPATLNNGDWIRLFDDIEAVKKYYQSSDRLGGPHVLQQYIDNPALIEGKKYTYRLHVFVTNTAGIYVYHRGYINISAEPYLPENGLALKKMHITNYMIDGDLAHITQQPTDGLPHFQKTHQKMGEMLSQLFRALCREHPTYLDPKASPRFEIFGCDFMEDATGRLWLLEVNQGADAPMYEDNPLKPILWQPFWDDVVNDLVLPVANGQLKSIQNPHFCPILSASDCYAFWRVLWHKVLGRG